MIDSYSLLLESLSEDHIERLQVLATLYNNRATTSNRFDSYLTSAGFISRSTRRLTKRAYVALALVKAHEEAIDEYLRREYQA